MLINISKKQKTIVVLVTFTSITKKTKEKKLEQIFCIWYSVIFKDWIEALLDTKSKINIMSQAFTS